MMTVDISAASKPVSETYTSALQNVDENNLLTDLYYFVMIIGAFQYLYLEMLRDRHGLWWAMSVLRMYFAFWLDCEAISPAQTMKLSKDANIFTYILQSEVTFVKTMHITLGHAKVFKGNCSIRFVEMHIKNNVNDTFCLKLMDAKTKETYMRHTMVSMMIIKHYSALYLLLNLVTKMPAA